MEKLLNEKEVEKIFGIKRSCLQKWRCLGGGPNYIKIGRSVRYRPSDIENFIHEHQRISTSDPGIIQNESV